MFSLINNKNNLTLYLLPTLYIIRVVLLGGSISLSVGLWSMDLEFESRTGFYNKNNLTSYLLPTLYIIRVVLLGGSISLSVGLWSMDLEFESRTGFNIWQISYNTRNIWET